MASFLVAASAAVLLSSATSIAAPNRSSSSPPAGGETRAPAGIDSSTVLVRLASDPLATSPRTRPARGRRLELNAPAVRNERAVLAAQRNDLKAWLRENAPRARVTGEWDVAVHAVAVRLNGESPDTVAQAPNVASVAPQILYRPTGHADPDLSIIRAAQAWTSGGSKGAGIEVAVIDTGIDIQNPCFWDGSGQPPANALTNGKVIVAKVFYNKTGKENLTPAAIQDHGTHVAGTVACNEHTPATVNGVTIPYEISGVAPEARLGNYNVFPGHVDNARSEDILNALQAAYEDGMDVANLSLGGNANGKQDLLTHAIDNYDAAGMVVAVAAGNSGPGRGTVESPGSAAGALTAGASTVPHFVGAAITAGGAVGQAASGDFATVSADLTAPLAKPAGTGVARLSTACSALSGIPAGSIVMVSRGACTFSTKVRFVQQAGGAAAIVVNNVAGDPIAMGQDGTPNQPTIPAYMIGNQSPLTGVAAGTATTIPAAMSYFTTTNGDIMAGFSSQGPTDVDARVKPDVVAPGVNVLSSVLGADFAFFQGTSMATPHLAGSAAVLMSAHPEWTSQQIRSAIVNTARRTGIRSFTGSPITIDLNTTGAGIEDLAAAEQTVVALDPVSVSFGAVPVRSKQPQSRTVTIAGLRDAGTLSVSTTGPFTASATAVTVNKGGTATLTITYTPGTRGENQGWLDLKAGGTSVAHAALFAIGT